MVAGAFLMVIRPCMLTSGDLGSRSLGKIQLLEIWNKGLLRKRFRIEITYARHDRFTVVSISVWTPSEEGQESQRPRRNLANRYPRCSPHTGADR